MKQETKKAILNNEIKQHLKRKKTTIKNKVKKEIVLQKQENTSIILSNFLVSINASLTKNITLTQAQRDAKRHLKTRNDILNSQLSQDDKTTLLKYNNLLNVKIKDIDKTIKSELKANILKVLQDNIKTNNTLETDAKKFFIDIEIKNNLNNLIKSIFNVSDNFSFNTLKKAILSAYVNKLTKA